MKIVITGAGSFLGVTVCRSFQEAGDEVTAVCRAQSAGLAKIPKGVSVVHASLEENGELVKRIEEREQAKVFIHLAWAGTGHDGRDEADVQEANVRYALEAMRAAHAMGCKLFVMTGSQAEYGSTTLPQQEEMECKPFSEYGKAKLRMWEEGKKLAAELGMKYLHLRIFSLIGEEDHPWTLVMSAVEKMLRDETMALSDCTQNWNFLYARDAAEQIRRLCAYAMEEDAFGQQIYQIASDDTRPLKDFVERIRVLTGSKSDLQYGAVKPSNRVSLQPDMGKLRKAIGMEIAPTDFDTVIERIIATQNDKTI